MLDSFSSSTKQFSYDILDTDRNRNQIQVLEILHEHQDALSCKLKTVDLDDHTLEYKTRRSRAAAAIDQLPERAGLKDDLDALSPETWSELLDNPCPDPSNGLQNIVEPIPSNRAWEQHRFN
jgi:hypothetical protein